MGPPFAEKPLHVGAGPWSAKIRAHLAIGHDLDQPVAVGVTSLAEHHRARIDPFRPHRHARPSRSR